MQRSCIHFALLHNKLKQTVAENNTHISVSRSYKSEVWTQDDWVLRSGSHSAEIKVLAGLRCQQRLTFLSQVIQVVRRIRFLVMTRLRSCFHAGCPGGLLSTTRGHSSSMPCSPWHLQANKRELLKCQISNL